MKVLFILSIVLFIASISISACQKTPTATSKDQKMATETAADEGRKSDFDLMAVMTDCNDTFRVELAYLESLNKSGSFPDETDRTPMCFVRCVLENSQVVAEDGIFDPMRTVEVFSLIRDGVPMDAMREIATNCSALDETMKCERSYKYLKCLIETELAKYETT